MLQRIGELIWAAIFECIELAIVYRRVSQLDATVDHLNERMRRVRDNDLRWN